jgi:transposase
MRGRRKTSLALTEVERVELQAFAVRRKTAQAGALRARIVLACAEGMDNNTVAERLKVTKQTVSKWRGRFLKCRRDGFLDVPRSGAPRSIETSGSKRW